MHQAVISGLHFSGFNGNYLLLAANSAKDKAPFGPATSSWEYSQTGRIHVHSYDTPTWSAVDTRGRLFLYPLQDMCMQIYYIYITWKNYVNITLKALYIM